MALRRIPPETEVSEEAAKKILEEALKNVGDKRHFHVGSDGIPGTIFWDNSQLWGKPDEDDHGCIFTFDPVTGRSTVMIIDEEKAKRSGMYDKYKPDITAEFSLSGKHKIKRTKYYWYKYI